MSKTEYPDWAPWRIARVRADETEVEPPVRTPERRLLNAMLARALRDAASQPRTAESREGMAWLRSEADENHPFSFAWVCLHLDLDWRVMQKVVGKYLGKCE